MTSPMPTSFEIADRDTRRLALVLRDVGGDGAPIGSGWMACDVVGSWATYGVGLGLEGPIDDTVLDDLVEFYRSRKRQPRIKVTAHEHPSVKHGLENRGFVALEEETVLVHTLDHRPPTDSVPGLVFRSVDPSSTQDIEVFWTSQTRGFFEDKEPPAGMRPIIERVIQYPRASLWFMELDGQIVGGGGLEVFKNSGVLFAGCVHPEARRQGLHSAFIGFRLQAAVDAGLRYAVITSLTGEPTHRNALRAGFSEAYTQHNFHLPSAG